ncbi:hypothetical protein BURKHO8Y_210638 [Burkholderia sp. 8Y]|nr:hypothetical protein BURKHO8Y_210638 [Burkholderia sp. 8Y]
MFLKLVNLVADRALRNGKLAGGENEAQMTGYRLENAQSEKRRKIMGQGFGGKLHIK